MPEAATESNIPELTELEESIASVSKSPVLHTPCTGDVMARGDLEIVLIHWADSAVRVAFYLFDHPDDNTDLMCLEDQADVTQQLLRIAAVVGEERVQTALDRARGEFAKKRDRFEAWRIH